MYSGSLGTSPNRGFWIRSQRDSADLISTEGSEVVIPTIERRVEQPAKASATTARPARRRIFMRRLP
jgi:hypothetical protein